MALHVLDAGNAPYRCEEVSLLVREHGPAEDDAPIVRLDGDGAGVRYDPAQARPDPRHEQAVGGIPIVRDVGLELRYSPARSVREVARGDVEVLPRSPREALEPVAEEGPAAPSHFRIEEVDRTRAQRDPGRERRYLAHA